MKFLRPRPFSGGNLDGVTTFLRIDLAKIFSDLVEGLKHLTFRDNFDSFEVDVSLGNGETVAIPNRLGSKTVKWFPVRIMGDARLVEAQPFTNEFVFIKNASTTATTATLVFMR